MKSESISSAKNRLSALIRRVRKGESVVITDRGVPVAKLVPVQLGAGVPPRIIALAHQGLVRLPLDPPNTDWLDLPLPMATPGPSPVDLLLEERREGW